MTERTTRIGRIAIVLVGVAITAVAAWWLFVIAPRSLAELLGVVLVLLAIPPGARFAGRIAEAVVPDYNVAEVAVEGPITRDGRTPVPGRSIGTTADDVVEQIERADEDGNAKALLVKLNTPGGQVVPSDDIRRAAEAFDGPTVAYATDVCASGGYWIASGCDALWARDASIVGSIGVVGSRVNAAELADRLGLSYERLAAGKYKDAGTPLKEMTEDERAYLQDIVDDYYERFVSRVTEGREIDAEDVRETEARVYLGGEAKDRGLVDGLGDREDVEDYLEGELDEPVSIREFEPHRSLAERLRGGAASVAHAFGAGVASVLGADGREFAFELR